jgi:hypothetical protein
MRPCGFWLNPLKDSWKKPMISLSRAKRKNAFFRMLPVRTCKMKLNLITLAICSVIFLAATGVRLTLSAGVSAHHRYYVTAILTISGILTVITLLRLTRLRRSRPAPARAPGGPAPEQHRNHFRMRFDRTAHPVFVEKISDREPGAAFTCAVHDISETGVGLGCTGVYANGETVQGEIIFDSGRTAPVNGVVIREEMDRTCLRLHCSIDPPLLMAEQRELIRLEKAAGPRPAVSRTVLDKRTGGLPSHSPKGICRLKRP